MTCLISFVYNSSINDVTLIISDVIGKVLHDYDLKYG